MSIGFFTSWPGAWLSGVPFAIRNSSSPERCPLAGVRRLSLQWRFLMLLQHGLAIELVHLEFPPRGPVDIEWGDDCSNRQNCRRTRGTVLCEMANFHDAGRDAPPRVLVVAPVATVNFLGRLDIVAIGVLHGSIFTACSRPWDGRMSFEHLAY